MSLLMSVSTVMVQRSRGITARRAAGARRE